MIKTAWIFPGQGSQSIGMGTDFLDLPQARHRFNQADDLLGWSVLEVCQNIEDMVSRTLYTQPCLYVVESILVDLMVSRGHYPDLVAGHSLGEYTALYTGGVFSFESGLQLVKRRAELMDRASDGMMAALIGCDRHQLEQYLTNTPDVVLANDNNDGQVVISGTPNGVKTVLTGVKSKRAIPLNVSGAFHSPLMADAAEEFAEVLDAVTFEDSKVPVLSNIEPSPTNDAALLKNRLRQQMTGSVRWREISLRLPEEGIGRVVELGPGKVLTGLIKRTAPSLILENIGTLADIPM